MKALTAIASMVGLGLAMSSLASPAEAGDWSIGIGISVPGVVVVPGSVYQPAPPAYYVPASPPGYVVQPPYYAAPYPPQYVVVPPSYGWDYGRRHHWRHHDEDDDDD